MSTENQSTDHESVLKSCLENPALRDALLEELGESSPSKPDRLRKLGRWCGRLHTRLTKATEVLNQSVEEVREGYRDALNGSDSSTASDGPKGDSDVESNG